MGHSCYIELNSKGFADVINITGLVEEAVRASNISDGLTCVFVPGSTGSVTTIEYEEGVIEDLKEALDRLIPSDKTYKHDERWGDGNGFSHVRAAMMKPGITIPVINGELTIGTWQQIVFIDFDNRPRTRHLVVQVTGD